MVVALAGGIARKEKRHEKSKMDLYSFDHIVPLMG